MMKVTSLDVEQTFTLIDLAKRGSETAAMCAAGEHISIALGSAISQRYVRLSCGKSQQVEACCYLSAVLG